MDRIVADRATRHEIVTQRRLTCIYSTYGTTLRLPGEFFTASSSNLKPTLEFITKLKRAMASIRPTPTSNHSNRTPFVQREMATCSHVFVKVGVIKPPLTQPFDGPFRVLRRKKKVYIVDINGKPSPISIDRLKAAFVQTDDTSTAPTKPEPEEKPYTTRSGRQIKIPCRYW
ncbi:uncharacterized protein LOC129729168 [Wyeomyia smithii]|uniref:uncharacterized protein LOC129729168 n=1 Tax=Wyeomyia smithii TaxID=174621 RepID=UPI002467DE6E|nr:uncharacterized protein LOC129729168 [Wyeomyia smithii]